MENFKGYITKYALTMGIQEMALITSGTSLALVKPASVPWGGYYYGEGQEWHRDRASAVKRAEEMRRAKIKVLRKQLAKLENLTFSEA